MLSKQLTSRLKEEQEKDQHQLNVAQCDRLIRTVSCKDDEKHGVGIQSPSKTHEANHAIKKVNINVLQLFDDIRLYVPPSYVVLTSGKTSAPGSRSGEQSPPSVVVGDQKESALSSPSKSSEAQAQPATGTTGEVLEVNFKDVLAHIIDSLSPSNVSSWFSLNSTSSPTAADDSQSSSFMSTSLFDSISQALQLIDFNLKRNSDFINELTKLLDTSRAIKQEAHLKKLLKTLEDEKLTGSSLPVPQLASLSQPSSPIIKPANSENEVAQRAKSKSFKGFGGKSKSKENNSSAGSTVTTPTNPSNQFLAPPSQSSLIGVAQSSPNGSTSNLLATLLGNKPQQLSSPNDNEMINNSDYIELELEVEQIAFSLDKLNKLWTRLAHSRQALSNGDVTSLKYALELQNMLNELNSVSILNDLDNSLFKLNWLVTSKSGFSEPNWKTNVLSLTPSTIDSFIGVNLLKNYYKYVKYDFVSYKLFTRQLQLIQLSAVLLSLIHRILNFYKETITLSSINGASFLVNSSAVTTGNSLSVNSGATSGAGVSAVNPDALNQSLLSFSFSADKFKPISWSANHVTLYNVQSGANKAGHEDKLAANRGSPVRRDTSQSRSREEQIRQIKNELFLRDVNEFLKLSTQRLNIQSSLANRTGYFYIVNKSTGLVLQAVDFASDYSLKDQIENNQKRLQSVKAKGGSSHAPAAPATPATGGSPVTKGPRFYLMPKANNATNQQNVMNQKSGNQQVPNTSSLLHDSSSPSNDEQLWYYYLINGCVANKIIRSGYCMAASSLNPKSPVTFWPNVKTTNCSWFFNHQDSTIVSGLSEDLVLDYAIIDDGPKQRYSVIIDQKVPNKASQKWSFEFC